MFSYVYLCFLVLVYLCLQIFTCVDQYLPTFNRVYLCLPLYTSVSLFLTTFSRACFSTSFRVFITWLGSETRTRNRETNSFKLELELELYKLITLNWSHSSEGRRVLVIFLWKTNAYIDPELFPL